MLTGHAVTWAASGGASISATGVVTGASAGTALVTVTAMSYEPLSDAPLMSL